MKATITHMVAKPRITRAACTFQVAGVREFLSSDKHIHMMRDHPAHVAYMMGGTWGAKVNKERLNFFTSFKKLFQVMKMEIKCVFRFMAIKILCAFFLLYRVLLRFFNSNLCVFIGKDLASQIYFIFMFMF